MMKKAEEILREYIDFDDVNGSEAIELLPLTIIDIMEEYASQFRKHDVIKSVCDVCGSDDIIEAPHMGKNCNRCHPL